MRHAEPDRHVIEDDGYSQHELRYHDAGQRQRADTGARAPQDAGNRHGRTGRKPRQTAVNELHAHRIGNGIGGAAQDAIGHQRPEHQRPRIGGVTRPEPGGECPPDDLHRQQRGERPHPGAGAIIAARITVDQIKRRPDAAGHDDESIGQMCRQPFRRHLRPIDQAGCDHPPADGPLQAAQRKQRQQPQLVTSWNLAANPEPRQRQRKRQPDQPAEQPVDIFPEKDALELGQAHAAVHQLILARLLIQRKLL